MSLKKLFVFIFLLFLLVIPQTPQALANWVSGGGDPKYVEVQSYPNMSLLKEAVFFLQKRVKETPFNRNFKDAFITDTNVLLKMGRFYYVSELFTVGLNRFSGDYTTLVSNGAMTEYSFGAPVYFSKQVIEYDKRTLARVIAQEVVHHIFSGRFQKDEIFANNLGTYIVAGGEIPTKPYNAAQIIYEEFDTQLRDESSKNIMAKAKTDFEAGKDVLDVLYFLGHELYKNFGSYGNYHVEFEYLRADQLGQRHPKNAKITKLENFKKEAIKKCVFATYLEGPSGITNSLSQKISNSFAQHLGLFEQKINNIYLVENFFLPATEGTISDCGVGVEDKQGRVFIFKAIKRHEDNQMSLPVM
ncbi:MAG: hypothetical protein ISR65_07525 [Bacteriovoracaceae bacterium]|nr:hypothetical protein [Bacteriovoracaceae bacterium]